LFIIGESNTQKTTLIVKPLINFFGEENIGIITHGNNFNFQDLQGKILSVIDEYKHDIKLNGQLLKIFEGSNIKAEKKYKNVEIIENIPIILIANKDINIKDEKIMEAFNNRIMKLYFLYKLKKNEIDENITEKIKKEEASIKIHCNKIYFETINEKKTRLNYNKSLELINFFNENNNENNTN
jgi:phage/plasmid-associated DNA primase